MYPTGKEIILHDGNYRALYMGVNQDHSEVYSADLFGHKGELGRLS